MKISPYYASLIKEKGDPIWKQCIPSLDELHDVVNDEDPLHEEQYTPVPFLVHRYPDRVLFLVSNKCAMYCRFCTRKRKVGMDRAEITREQIDNALEYIRQHHEVRDVLLSGGDPLMLKNDEIEYLLKSLRAIAHVEIIRIGSRVPCTLPQRVDEQFCTMLKKYHPLFMNVHFEHPMEITPESSRALNMLADAGIVLGSQTVLLKGVNDDPKVLKELFHKLLQCRVKPYYLYQADQVKGTEHFRTSIDEALAIMHEFYGHTTGLSVPLYIVDTYGGGKIPVIPDYLQFKNKDKYVFKNFEGKIVEYINPKPGGAVPVIDKPFKIAVIFNLKRAPEKGQPVDFYAEFDDITVPTAIKTALEKNGYVAELVEATTDMLSTLKEKQFDFAFNIAEGLSGAARESQVPALLDLLNIPYVGSGVFTMAATLDKARTKEILLHHQVSTPNYQLFTTWNQTINSDLHYPLFVKPNAEGSSKGITNSSLVHDMKELRKVLKQTIALYNQPALVEEYLDGREFTVSILGNDQPKVMPIVEITFDYLPKHINKVDSYEVKWIYDNPQNAVDPVICPAKISEELEQAIRKTALQAYKVLGCVDFCRMDVRLDSKGVPHVIDVNALPGLMPDPKENSRFPKSCYTAGMTYDEMIMTILSEAMKRYKIKPKHALPDVSAVKGA